MLRFFNIKGWIGGFLILLPCLLCSQPQLPANNELFLQEEVATIRISIDPDSLDVMLADVEYGSTHEFPATFVYSSSVLYDSVSNVGFRIRGNTSIYSGKKSFKVSFNTFTQGGKFLGVEKLNLNGEHNDPSIMRAKLSWELLRNIGLPGSRTSYILLYINGEYRGVYLNVEHIDEEFTRKVFDDGSGNLYKCLYPADLTWRGPDPEDYNYEVNGRRPYHLQGNRTEEDYSDLARFITALNQTGLQFLPYELETLFNVDDYLKFAAFDILIGNWDGYIYNKNNFYLYHNQRSGRMEFLAYDLDNTLGIDWIGRDWATRDPYTWDHESRPLFSRLMDVPQYREQFTWYLDHFRTEFFTETFFQGRAAEIQTLIGPHVQNDPYYPLDYGFTYTDFTESLDQAWGAPMVDYGIWEYVDARRTSLPGQLDPVPPAPPLVLNHLSGESPRADTLRFRAYVEGGSDSVSLLYTLNGGPQQSVPMLDDGQQDDRDAGDLVYGVQLPLADTLVEFSYQIQARANGVTRTEPCTPKTMFLGRSTLPIVINELMAANSQGIQDEFDERDDWIELYNAGTSPIDLSTLYLTDDFDDPDKFDLPLMSLLPQDFALFWADNDPEQGGLHAPFNLNKSGEEVVLFEKIGDKYYVVDRIDFGNQITNISFGREEDASPNWITFTQPTPNASNHLRDTPPIELIFWPNPNLTGILFLSQPLDLWVYSTTGALVGQYFQVTSLDLSDWKSGMYFLRYEGGGV